MENKNSKIISIIVVIVFLSILGYFVFHKNKINTGPVANSDWQAGGEHLRERLDSIGLPALKEEGMVLHIHQHLDIFIDGKVVAVPAYIGIDPMGKFISVIHTHDTSGVIHVESPEVKDFTLGQFFDIWGVGFTQNSMGMYVSQGDKMLKVFVNGKEYTSDPRVLILEAHQEIVITFGTEKEMPKSIPSSYTFPDGE